MRITNAVLAERIKNVHTDVKEIKDAVKINTEFRIGHEATDPPAGGMGIWAAILLIIQRLRGG